MFATQSTLLNNNAFTRQEQAEFNSMDQIKTNIFNNQQRQNEKPGQSSAVKAKKAELTKIQTENENLQQKRQALMHKIEDLKQILRLVNEQGDDRIAQIKLRNIILKEKAAGLTSTLKTSRKYGAHLDQMAAFWLDNNVSVPTKKSFRQTAVSEPKQEEEKEEKPLISSHSSDSSQKHLLEGTLLHRCGGSDTTTTIVTKPTIMRACSKSTAGSSDQDQCDSDCGCCYSYRGQGEGKPIEFKPEPPVAIAASVQANL